MTAMAVACCFNPRAREERDLGIYARLNRITGFNPRAREERDVLG